MPLDSDQVFATEFHGEDGLGNIYSKGLHTAPTDWENMLLHKAEKEGAENAPFQTTPRDAADEILYQLSNAEPLTVSIIALGPLTNLALAIQRDPLTFSRAKTVIVLGGLVRCLRQQISCVHFSSKSINPFLCDRALVAGNITPYGEFNFVADPLAADIVMSASKGFDRTEQGIQNRQALNSKSQIAPMHIIVLPIDSKFNIVHSL
jgi:inosine-uridine nucleoside N-ribohydrolase